VSQAATARPRGRPAAATRDDAFAAARRQYLTGERVDIRAIAAETGLARATVYRWFGSREALLGEVIVAEGLALFRRARERARGTGGAALLDTFYRVNRGLANAPALRSFLEREREGALRILTSSAGPVQPHMVAAVAELIEDAVRAGDYEPPAPVESMAYAIVRLAESFIYNDAVSGIRGEIEPLRQVQAALLGVAEPAGR
jgi:AcrR family transcriptional regulator